MSDMSYLIDLFQEMRTSGTEELFSGEGELTEKVNTALDKLNTNADLAKQTLFERMSEKDLVIFILMVQKMVSTLAVKNGDSSILFAELSGELQAYTQTVLLSAIGTLIQDEIL